MRREQQILAAAEKLFHERSFDGVSVDELGAAAGITGGAIYRHFKSKDEILAVLFDQAIDALLVATSDVKEDPREDLLSLVTAHVDFATSHRGLAAVWFREQRALSEDYRRSFQRRQHRYSERWIESVARCYPGRSSEDIITAVRGLQALLMSDAIRPPGARGASDPRPLLTAIALASLAALDAQPTKASSAASNASGASNIG